MIRYGELCLRIRHDLRDADGEEAGKTARELVAFAAGKTREELARDRDLYVAEPVIRKTEELTKEYLAGKPLPYLLGEWSFYGLTLTVTPEVLIPRDDTMVVTALAMEILKDLPQPRVLDLCAGSGCIGLAIAHHLPRTRVTLAELSDDAIRVARENVTRCRLASRVTVVKADALADPPAYLKNYDVLVSNPPYIRRSEIGTLTPSVRDHEPRMALDGGEDGLVFYRAICRNYAPVLRDHGVICLEFGIGQQDAVKEILTENHFTDAVFCRDASEILRAVMAWKNGKE